MTWTDAEAKAMAERGHCVGPRCWTIGRDYCGCWCDRCEPLHIDEDDALVTTSAPPKETR